MREMKRLNFADNAESPAAFPWSYDARSRTVTVLTGDAQPKQGGSFILESRLKADAAPGTVITNQAFVHFPNALEQITPTNTVVSAVPLATTLAYEGASSAAYLAPARLASRLMTTAGRPLARQESQFILPGSTLTALTDSLKQRKLS